MASDTTSDQHPTCARCGWPAAQPTEVVSEHATSAGTVVYGRCVCGALRMYLRATAAGPAAVVVRAARQAGGTKPAESPALRPEPEHRTC